MAMADDNAPVMITFPSVMSRRMYDGQVSAEIVSCSVDGRELLRQYCEREGTLGLAYERYVQSAENRKAPHRLTRENFRNTKRLSSQGWRYKSVATLIDRYWPQLERVPTDADLLKTASHDADIIAVLVDVCDWPGINVSNATKLLYQKRPYLVPILDVFARMALNVPQMRGRGPQAHREDFERGFEQVRAVARYGTNIAALSQLEAWIRCDQSPTDVPLSRLRIIDILAWMMGSRDRFANRSRPAHGA